VTQQPAFEKRIAHTWAEHFGCSRDDLERAGTLIVPREHLARSGAIHIAHIRARAMGEVDPRLVAEIGHILAGAGEAAVLTAGVIRAAMPPERVLSADAGFIFHLNPGRLVPRIPEAPITLRPLGSGDGPALQGLFRSCTPEEVDDAFVEVDHEIACACFEGDRIVAAGSGYRRNGFMDLGVLTHPSYRGRRLAAALVSALSRESILKDVIPQYRCDRTNAASRRVAEVSGFTLFFDTESLRITDP
jgi:GNAT superfamily N-acetyltransferase